MKRFAIINRIFLVFMMIFGLIFMVACGNEGSTTGDDNGEFVYHSIEPDEYSTDTMAVLSNGYHLVWTDEFNYTGSPDATKWNYEVGGGGWGNGESQFYTSRDDNSYVNDGHLTITLKKENYSGYNYTSARLTTKNKGDFKYGYMEVRAMLPAGGGTWPAIWMMPTDSVYGGWPNSGELDIMEHVGNNPNVILGTTHTSVTGGGGAGGRTRASNVSTEWHTYAMEWTETAIKFLVDGNAYYTYSKLSNYDQTKWPFDQRFFMILNVAIGGNLGGNIASDFVESSMKVDYVRIYSKVDSNDTEAPSKPIIKNFISGHDSIHLDWDDATDNQGIKQYDIVLNNKQIGATVSNSYTIRNLKEATTYQVRLIAVDYNGNWSISDIYTIKTLEESKLPGKILGYTYLSATKNVNITSGSDTDGNNVLQIPCNTTVSFTASCTISGNYNIKLRLNALLSTNVTVEIFNGSNMIYSSSVAVGKSYGKYVDVALPSGLNLPQGSYTIKLTCEASGTGNAILLNYIDINK